METVPEECLDREPKLEREILQSYWERQMSIRAEARERITKNPMDTEAKLVWINADGQQEKLLDAYVDLGLCDEL